ncbi:hypothetical protein [Horticoccus sp. 23ND18S-11]|uniref:hypothetical protein n=1 Tax=Horticoccus sp. 23ND18S-11 TaxID=3391832 RepID=UPI0039C8F014
MKNNTNSRASFLKTTLALLLAVSFVGSMPTMVNAKGGAGGGGSVKVVESRVTGYVTAIDYVNSKIQIGASYYGSGLLNVTSSTDISLDNSACDFSAITLGTWVEARYDYATKNATKLSCTSVPTS